MTTALTMFLQQLTPGAAQQYKNLEIIPLLGANGAPVDYLTLDEAMQEGVLTIQEVDEAGQVPTLQVKNASAHKVLLLDGEELVGAKQNRVLNTTLLLAPQSVTFIPVSCIERGRWNYRGREFRSPERTMSAELRRKKNRSVHFCLRNFGAYHSDQGEIWQEIEAKFYRANVEPSPTQALSDLCEIMENASQDYLRHFSPEASQVGLAAAVDGALAGVDLLDRADTYRRLHRKLVASYVMDALETADRAPEPGVSTLAQALGPFLAEAAAAPVERRQSVALGWDLRLETTHVIGAGLEFEEQILHLSLFPHQNDTRREVRERPLRQASQRRRQMRG